MSSPTSAFLPPSPTDDSGGSGGSGGSTQRGANYFFGFLITFVGLLIIFIACGIGSRRRFAARREAMLNGTFEPSRRFSNGKSEVEEAPPQLYEYPLVISEDRWNSLMPLSVRFWREEEEQRSNSVAHNLQALPPATLARRSTRYMTGHIFNPFSNANWFPIHHKDSSYQTQMDPDLPETIQVAVMIVMPSKDLSPGAYNQPTIPERLPEYQIGSISLPFQTRNLHPDP